MRVCDFCKKELNDANNTNVAYIGNGKYIHTGSRFHIEIKDSYDDREFDICVKCRKKISQMIEKLLFEETCKEENDGRYVDK